MAGELGGPRLRILEKGMRFEWYRIGEGRRGCGQGEVQRGLDLGGFYIVYGELLDGLRAASLAAVNAGLTDPKFQSFSILVVA